MSFGSGDSVVFLRAAPASALFVASRPSGRVDLETESRGFVSSFARILGSTSTTEVETRSIPRADLAGHSAIGKEFVYEAPRGRLVATLYAAEFEGTSFIYGYATLSLATPSRSSIEAQSDADLSASDFFRLVQSLHRRGSGSPAPSDRPGPSPRPDRTKPDAARDVAAARP
jgi:hypothetical protein